MELDLTKGGSSAFFYGDRAKTYVLKNKVDFSQNNLASGDVVDLFNVPKGAVVLGVRVDVQTAEGNGTAATMDIGDGTSATTYAATADINAVSDTLKAATTLYAADDVIKATADQAVVAAVVEFTLIVIDASE